MTDDYGIITDDYEAITDLYEAVTDDYEITTDSHWRGFQEKGSNLKFEIWGWTA